MGDEITTRGYRVLTFAKCTTIMIVKLASTSGLGSSLESMVMVMEWFWYGYGCGMVLD
jgi:hypothetical protein